MSSASRDEPRDLAGYVLGELSADDRKRVERELAGDPALQREAAELRALTARLDDVDAAAFTALEPPPLRLDASDAPAVAGPAVERADDATVAAPAREPRARPRRSGAWTRVFGGLVHQPALAAVLLALVFGGGIGAGLLLSGGSDDDGVTRATSGTDVTLLPVGDLQPSASGDARLTASGDELRVRVSGLDPNDDDDFYEAWLMDSKQGLVSLGSFRVGADGSGTIDVPVPVDAKAFPVVDISLEKADGAPGHSGKSVLRAELT